MLYIFWGEDEFSMAEALQEIKSGLGESSMLETNTNVLDGQKVKADELMQVISAMPFLSPKRLVIVQGLLERFEARDKSVRPRKSAGSAGAADETTKLAECIKSIPESTVLVLKDIIENRKNALQNNALFNAISGQAETRVFPLMKGTRLAQWIESRVNRQSGSISKQATNVLMEIIGGDLFTMSNEISKLVAFTAGRMIEEKDIRLVVSASQEADIFAMIDAIMDRQAGTAERILFKLLQNGRVAPEILALLARQAQILVQIKDMKSRRTPAAEMQSKVGIYNPFAWEKTTRRAEKYTFDRLKEIYQHLLKTDLDIKTGRFEGDLALNLLVANLCSG